MEKIINKITNILNKEDAVIVGCSAGPDSMYLLSLLLKVYPKEKIICSHVNHGTRKACDEEEKYLQKFCNENNIIFELYKINKKITRNFENEAREERYNFFESLYEKYNAKYILTAHHNDDLLETILMRISRGSNLSGYVGIKELDGKYFRPLLEITKEEILDYLDKNNIKYFIDETNNEDKHTRNRFRHHVLPFFKAEVSNLPTKVIQYSEELLSYEKFVSKYINEKQLIKNNIIYIDNFLKEDEFIQRKTIEMLIKIIQKENLLEVSKQNVEDILNITKSSKSNCIVNLSGGFIAKKRYNKLTIAKQETFETFNIIFDNKYEDKNWIINKVSTHIDTSNYVVYLNSTEIKLPIHIRSFKNGDKMYVKNLGHKKVKDIFIDNKIDIDERKCYPLITDDNDNILLIPGIKKSKFAKDKNEKYDIILFSERKDK